MIHVIIVAAGRGSRFGGDLPKQFCILRDRPVLMHTIANIGRAMPDATITLVLSDWGRDYWLEMCNRYGVESPAIVIGGATRWESVKNAVDRLAIAEGDIVMIHDGARPIVGQEMARRLVAAIAEGADAAIPALPVTDSLRRRCPDGSSVAEGRSQLVAVQTPQAFVGEKLAKAYRLPYRPEFTDDASVFEYAGFGSPALVEGNPANIKITHPQDIEIAKLYLQ